MGGHIENVDINFQYHLDDLIIFVRSYIISCYAVE